MARKKYIISDIHGCYKSFNSLLFDKIKFTKKDRLYILGDYIDRGPRSKKVIDLIINLLIQGYEVKCLMGNHEVMLLNSLNNDKEFELWFKNGGKSTLDSFKVEHPKYLKNKYLKFFTNLDYYYELKEFVLVHGGLNFHIDNPFDDKLSMPWIRNDKVDINKIGNRRLIVGHTPSKLNKVKSSLLEDRILLDGGCIYSNMNKDMGNLIGLELNSMELFVQPNLDFSITDPPVKKL